MGIEPRPAQLDASIDLHPEGPLVVDPLICTTELRVPPHCRVNNARPERGRVPEPMTVAEAIELLQVALDTHVAWALYLADASAEERQRCYAVLGGLLWWDRMWISGYQDVIALLRLGCQCATTAGGDAARLTRTATRLLGGDSSDQHGALAADTTSFDERTEVIKRLAREPLEETLKLAGLRGRDSTVE